MVETRTIVLIAAIIFIAILLWYAMSKGIIPLSWTITESGCRTDMIRACNDAATDAIKYSQVGQLASRCSAYFDTSSCNTENGDQEHCQLLCQTVLTGTTTT